MRRWPNSSIASPEFSVRLGVAGAGFVSDSFPASRLTATLSPRWPLHLTPTKEVEVLVVDRLASVFATVDDDPIATFRDAGLPCDFRNHEPHVAE